MQRAGAVEKIGPLFYPLFPRLIHPYIQNHLQHGFQATGFENKFHRFGHPLYDPDRTLDP